MLVALKGRRTIRKRRDRHDSARGDGGPSANPGLSRSATCWMRDRPRQQRPVSVEMTDVGRAFLTARKLAERNGIMPSAEDHWHRITDAGPLPALGSL